MKKDKFEYIGQSKNGKLSFFRDTFDQTLIDYKENRVDEFIGEKETSMRTYKEKGKIEAKLHVHYGGGRPTIRILIPCMKDKSIDDADVDDLIFALKENLFSPENIKLDKPLEEMFKLFLIRRMV